MPYKTPRIEKQLRYVFWVTIVFLIGSGIYCNLTNKSTGGILYGRYGGSASIAYGAKGLFIMAAVLLLGAFLLNVFAKMRK
ncbi:MAG: hypothetical protein ACTHNW_02285 [Mucilaginibacter sp.]